MNNSILVLTQDEKNIIGAMLKELTVSQQYAFSTILATAEERGKAYQENDPLPPNPNPKA